MSPRRPIGRVKKLKISAAGVRVPPRAPIWVRGVISSRVRLRILWGNPWGCKSLRAHHAGLVSVEERRFRKPDVLRPNRRTSSIFNFASSSKATQRPIVRSKRHLKSFGAGCRESPERHREDHFRGTRARTATRGLVAFRKEEATSNQGMIGPSQRGVVEQPRVICVRYAGRNPALRKSFHGQMAKHGLTRWAATPLFNGSNPFLLSISFCGRAAIQTFHHQ